jgi:hypothetical protein
MKKRILSIFVVMFITAVSAQNAKVYLDFDGVTPPAVPTMPTGVSEVDAVGDVNDELKVYVNKNHYRADNSTGALVKATAASTILYTLLDNFVVDVSGNQALQMDNTGHLVIDEAAIGTGDFTIAGNYDAYGNTIYWQGFITVTGQNTSTLNYGSSQLQIKEPWGSLSGLGFTVGSSVGISATNAPSFKHFALTYTSSDQKYRFYTAGVLRATSSSAQASGLWDNKKVYLGFKGASLNTSTGDFGTYATNTARTSDHQKRVDDFTVFNRALSATEIATLNTTPSSALTIANVSWDGSESSDWANGDNWSTGAVPTATSVITIPSGMPNQPVVSATTGAIGYSLEVDGAASLTVESGGSLIVSGTSTGNVTYNVAVTDTDWHLVASPVTGEQYNAAWITASGIASGTTDTDNRGISIYNNGTPDETTDYWRYYQESDGDLTFGSGIGYSLKRTGTGNFSFTGTVPTSTLTPAISQGVNNWNLIGNSFPSYLDVDAFVTANTANLGGAFQAIYVWNGSAYVETTADYIYPGQAFFVSSNVGSGTASITAAMQSHQSGTTFLKSSNTDTFIKLNITDGTSNKVTSINYLEDKTRGLDPGFDIGMFNGVSSDLRVFTQLLEDNEGISFARQALPISDIETMVVALGVKAAAGKQITFSAETLNLPANLKVFLEDRETNTFTRLDVENSKYEVTLSESLNGVGRFFIHTSAKSVLSLDTAVLESVSIYKLDNATLRITGLSHGKVSVKLFNLLGKQMMHTSFEATTSKDIALSDLATGIYVVQLETENGNLNKKIILE